MKPQKIIGFEARNVMRLKAVKFQPKDGVNIIAGRNEQGKSCVLKSIAYPFLPGKHLPDGVIRDGEDRAEINMETQDFKIQQVLKRHGANELKVQRKDIEDLGDLKRPKGILGALVNGLAFDIMAFSELTGEKQAEQLMKLAGLDFSDLDERHDKAYQERRKANVDLKAAETMLSQMKRHDDAPDEEVSVSDLMAEVDRIARNNAKVTETDDVIVKLNGDLVDFKSELNANQRRIESLKEEIKELESENVSIMGSMKTLDDKINTARMNQLAVDIEDDTEVRAKIATAGQVNAMVRDNARYEEQKQAVLNLKDSAALCDVAVKEIAKERQERIKGADMPIAGLGFDDNGNVTFNGHLLSNCCQSQRIKVSAAVGAAINPKMPIATITEGSLLDEESNAAIAEIAEKYHAQIFIELVGKDHDGAIVIEDGEVVG